MCALFSPSAGDCQRLTSSLTQSKSSSCIITSHLVASPASFRMISRPFAILASNWSSAGPFPEATNHDGSTITTQPITPRGFLSPALDFTPRLDNRPRRH
ncbi:hypothetical protein E2C01_099013 [Portunus trituberculatus]|uniref:Uncharacterized protein n=1 Tax=Portunus trituberculatus TaxID=210409 RepID=A0A5B7K968_PORTR|nr:hypothetical protein [Portunus trituberculatus]